MSGANHLLMQCIGGCLLYPNLQADILGAVPSESIGGGNFKAAFDLLRANHARGAETTEADLYKALLAAGVESRAASTFPVECSEAAKGEDLYFNGDPALRAAERLRGIYALNCYRTSFTRLAEADFADCFEAEVAIRDVLATTPTPWGTPLPLHNVNTALPEFPMDALSSAPWVLSMVESVSRAVQVDKTMVAPIGLAILSGAPMGRVAVRFKAAAPPEPVQLWVCAIAEPGERKSPAMDPFLVPYQSAERASAARAAKANEENEHIVDIHKRRLEAAKKAYADGDESAAQEIRKNHEKLKELAPVAPRELLIDNTTPEAMVEFLVKNGGEARVFVDEPDFLTSFDRYNDNPDYSQILKSHNGKRLKVHRRGRVEIVDSANVAMAVMGQPVIVRELAKRPAMFDRGFFERLQLVSVPERTVPRSPDDIAISPYVQAEWDENIRRLLDIKPQVENDGQSRPHVLRFSAGAKEVWVSFFNEKERAQLRGRELEDARKWLNKTEGLVARIAGLLHLAKHIRTTATPWDTEIDRHDAAAAVSIIRFFLAHHIHARAVIDDAGMQDDAGEILKWIKSLGRRSFDTTEVWASRKRKLEEAPRMYAALNRLESAKCIRKYESEPRQQVRGRQAADRYLVNPAVLA